MASTNVLRARSQGQRNAEPSSSSSSSSTMHVAQQMLEYVVAPFRSCMPSTSDSAFGQSRQSEESRGLLTDNTYEDSDAISLLSNIADRSRRRNRAARQRERWNNSAAALGCGLFGRPKGQIQRRNVTAGDGERPRIQRHVRSDSADSAPSTTSDDESVGRAGSLAGAQESGDEDAGMLADADIAELSQSRDQEDEDDGEEERNRQEAERKAAEEEQKAAAEAEIARRAKEAAEEEAAAAAKRKEELERQAAESARIEAENAAKQKAEEEALAAQEEAEIAKARRRAERKAIKEGLLQARALGQREPRRLTEAEAEAAAGGFDFAEEPEFPPEQAHEYSEEYSPENEYGLAQGPEGYGYYQGPPPGQQDVVHHHHYYHEPQAEDVQDERYSPSAFQSYASPIPQLNEHRASSDDEKNDVAVQEEDDEDDADIAGLAFSKNRRKRGDRDGSYASRSNGSGSGSRQSGSANHVRRYDHSNGLGVRNAGGSNSSAGRRESLRSATGDEAGSSNGGGSASGKPSYRDRPRRHERTGSRSTGSGAGRPLREGPSGKMIVTSPTIPESDSSLSALAPPASDDAADAAAGGFDDFVPPPPPPQQQPPSGLQHSGYGPRLSFDEREQRRTSISHSSSSSARASRRREGPRTTQTSGLNTPRNPRGENVFARQTEYDDVDGL